MSEITVSTLNIVALPFFLFNRVWKGISGIRDLTKILSAVSQFARETLTGFGIRLRPEGSGIRQSYGTGCGIGKENDIQDREEMRTVRDAGFSCLSLAVAGWENIRFSSLFASGDVSRGGTTFVLAKRPQQRIARRNGCFRRLISMLLRKLRKMYFAQEF